jgi:fibronectin type 3 domain-containing protein
VRNKRNKTFAVLLFGVLVAVLLCTVPALAQENLSGTSGPDDHAGLKGEYYDNLDFTNLKLTRTDPKVDFSWGSGSPDPSIGPDTFSVRWSGQVKADHTQTYTFYTTTNDGARLWVNGQQIINRWSDGIATNTGTISLQAGQWHSITMEYYEGVNTASAKLEYSSPSTPRQVVPTDHLRPEAPPDTTAPTVSSTAPAAGATGVAVGANAQATFSKAMDEASVETPGNFTLTEPDGPDTGSDPDPVTAASVVYDSNSKTVTFDPSENLKANTTYTATVKGGTSGVKDLVGNPLASDKTWSFTTAASPPSNNLAAPTNLTAVRSGGAKAQRIDLSWIDNATGEAKFVIERSTTLNFDSNLVTFEVMSANATGYRDTAVQPTSTYYYRVFAVSSAGVRSPQSNVASATTR